MASAFNKFKDMQKNFLEGKYTLSEDAALKEVFRIYSYYNIDVEKLEAEQDAQKNEKMMVLAFKQLFQRFLQGIRLGHIEIVEYESTGIPTFKVNLQEEYGADDDDKKVVVLRPHGEYNDKAMRNLSDESNVFVQSMTLLGAMIGKPTQWVENRKGKDKLVFEAIAHFFLSM